MNSLLKRAFTCLNHPIVYGNQLLRELYDDYLAITGKISYRNNLFFIAGLPKSGTNWLQNLIAEVPGYINLTGSFLRTFHGADELQHPHGINHRMLSSAPENRYTFLKCHTHYDPGYITILDEFNIRPIILVRDLRDMMLSRYYHIIAEPTHWSYNEIKELPFDEGFETSLFSVSPNNKIAVIEYYKNWIVNWLRYVDQNPLKAIVVKYEDMKTNLPLTLNRIFAFYEMRFNHNEILQIIDKSTRHRMSSSLSKNLKLPGRLKTTFRKGIIGDWKNCFTEGHKAIFKKEVGELLILSGYEKDLNW